MRAQIEQVPRRRAGTRGLWLDDDGRNRGEPLWVEVEGHDRRGRDHRRPVGARATTSRPASTCRSAAATLPGIYTIDALDLPRRGDASTDFIPQNDGIFRPINVMAQEGTLFNPTFPRSALARAYAADHGASDAVIKALADVVPDKVCAGASTLSASASTPATSPRSRSTGYTSRSTRARTAGVSARMGWTRSTSSSANSRNTPIEEIDLALPAPYRALRADDRIRRRPGRWRGGIGIVRVNRFLEDGVVHHRSPTERTRRRGGCSAAATDITMHLTRIDPDGSREPLLLEA